MSENENHESQIHMKYDLDRQVFMDDGESELWKLLNTAAENQESWQIVFYVAQYVINKEGENAEEMESFFKNFQDESSQEWENIAKKLSKDLNKKPEDIITEVQRVTDEVEINVFRKLISLDRISYCYYKYKEDSARLRKCIANI